ncbi:MAG: hypothetical protein ABIJ65_03900 [Chloroflexota bacterium]
MSSKTLAGLIFVFIFGGILISTWMNWWSTKSDKTPAKFTQGEFTGEYNPLDIRGSYTFGDIESTFGIPLDLLAKAFALPANTDAYSFQVKTLESIYSFPDKEIGTASVRLFVALYTGLPLEITEGTYLPSQAVEILKLYGTLTSEQIDFIESHSILIETSVSIEPVTENPVESELSTSQLIKGKTTFKDLLDWGVSQPAIESILGGEMPNPLIKIKDYCMENNLLFETVKIDLQVLVDELP